MATASTAAAPATGPELVKFSSDGAGRLQPLRVGDQLLGQLVGHRRGLPAHRGVVDAVRSAVCGVIPNWANTGIPARVTASTASG